jgi:squalene-hopene/tetraprenyl-beta-curcumene cyclase
MLHVTPKAANQGPSQGQGPSAVGSPVREAGTLPALDPALELLDARLAPWRERARRQLGRTRDADRPWLLEIPDVGPTCEVLLADRLLHDLTPAERDAMLEWVRGEQDPSGAWLDVHGRADLSLTVLAYWALVQAGDDRASEPLVKAVRVVHALGGAQRADFQVRLWLAMAGLIDWSWLPAIPAELFLLPPQIPVSPARFSPWARGVLTPYLLIARAPARLHLVNVSELLLRRSGESLVAPRLTRAGFAGDLLQAFDHAVKISRKLPRGPLPKLAAKRAVAWLDTLQQEHGGWFSARPTLLSLIALRVVGARTDDPRIRRGLDYLRRARGHVIGREGKPLLAQGHHTVPLTIASGVLATRFESSDAAAVLRAELHERGPWQLRADAPAGGWPTEPGARSHLDLAATLAALDAIAELPPGDLAAGGAWTASSRASAVLLAMQEPSGGFARFERGEADVFMQRLPWTDADLLAYGRPADATHVELTSLVLERLATNGLRAEDDRLARGLVFLGQRLDDRNDPPSLATICAVARAVGALLPPEHAMRQDVERRIRIRQRDDGSFGAPLDTALALRALVALGHGCVQAERAARNLVTTIERDADALASGKSGAPAIVEDGPGLSAHTIDPTAAARQTVVALRAWSKLQRQVTEIRR